MIPTLTSSNRHEGARLVGALHNVRLAFWDYDGRAWTFRIVGVTRLAVSNACYQKSIRLRGAMAVTSLNDRWVRALCEDSRYVDRCSFRLCGQPDWFYGRFAYEVRGCEAVSI